MAPPHISREKQSLRISAVPLGGLEHVAGAHPGGEEGLVGVPHGGVGDEQLLLSQHPVPHRLWPLLIQKLLEAGALGRGVLVGREAGNVELGPLSGGLSTCIWAMYLSSLVARSRPTSMSEELRESRQ